jgi:hypothetical protein
MVIGFSGEELGTPLADEIFITYTTWLTDKSAEKAS